jgi:Condensation domain
MIDELTAAQRERLLAVAKSLGLAGKDDSPALIRVERSERIPLSFAQQRLWFLAQMEGVSEAYRVSFAVLLKGEVSRPALRRALNRIVERHEALRTTFGVVDGEPVQRIAGVEESSFHLLEHDLGTQDDAKAAVARLIAREAGAEFDLQVGPLIRGLLIRVRQDEHVLLIRMHHIVSDGWSMGVLIQELSALYSAFVRNEDDPLPELKLQYADYAVWQRKWMEGEILREQAEYWKKTLAGVPELLNVPTDHARPAQQDFAGDRGGWCWTRS